MASGLVGFAGSRSLASSWSPLVSSVVAAVLASGRGVAVGCAVGADALVLSSFVSPPAALRCSVFAAFGPGGAGSFAPVSAVSAVSAAAAAGASVLWGSGGPLSLPLRVRLARRSAALVRALALPCPSGSALVVFLASPSSRGSLRAARLAVRLGLPVFAFVCGFPGPPPLLSPRGAWSLVGGSGPFAASWLWPSPGQLPLF